MIIPVLFDSTICISKHLSGGSRWGARGAPSLFLDQTDARRAEKNFFGDHPLRPHPPSPLSQDLDDVVFFSSLLSYLFVYFFVCLFNPSKAKMLTRVQTLQKSQKVNMKYYKENVTICTKIYNLQLIDWLTNWLAD